MSKPRLAPDFTAGFAARHDAAAQILHQAFSRPSAGFAAADPRERAANTGPVSFSPQAPTPRHFHPADPTTNPTEGWDPFAPVTPMVDPVAAAHAAGYAEGLAAAQGDAGDAVARDLALITQLGEALRVIGRADRDRMAHQLRNTVLLLVTKLVGEIGIAPDVLLHRIDGAAELLADSAESKLLHLHPGDIALLDGRLPETVFAVGDASVARGSFVLESASTIVEDGPELWIEQLALAIDQVAVPPAC